MQKEVVMAHMEGECDGIFDRQRQHINKAVVTITVSGHGIFGRSLFNVKE
jgi:hypothetical protein